VREREIVVKLRRRLVQRALRLKYTTSGEHWLTAAARVEPSSNDEDRCDRKIAVVNRATRRESCTILICDIR